MQSAQRIDQWLRLQVCVTPPQYTNIINMMHDSSRYCVIHTLAHMQDSLDYASKFLQIWRTLIHPQCHWPTTHIPFYADFACKWEYALQLICIRIIGISGVLTALKRIFKSELLSAWKVAWSFDRGGEEREKGKWTPASTLLDEVYLLCHEKKK